MRLVITALTVAICTSGCEHYCLNNFVQSDCDTRIHTLQRKVTELTQALKESHDNIAHLRMTTIEVNEARCPELY